MREMIAELINGNIRGILFCLPFIIIPIILIILMIKFEKVRPQKITSKICTYSFLMAAFMMGIISTVPIIGPTMNLVKDYNELIFLSEEGIVEERIIRPKNFDLLEIENEFYIQSRYIEQLKEGDNCKIHYLKNSKYIYELEIKNGIGDYSLR